MATEEDLVRWLSNEVSKHGPSLLGDDTALLAVPSQSTSQPAGQLASTLDQQIEGVHLPTGVRPEIWARRLLAVNLSDLAAAGATPWVAMLAVAAPKGWDHRAFFRAFLRAARRYGVTLAGGDLATSDRLHFSLTLLGKTSERSWRTRTEARVGDRIWLGGALGLGALGLVLVERGATFDGRSVQLPDLPGSTTAQQATARKAVRRYFVPEPQLELGAWLAGRRRAAAIDLSDGLGKDLTRVVEASSVGAWIDSTRLPLRKGFRSLVQRLQRSPQQLALHGGDDYVLLFTLPAKTSPPAQLNCTEIGRIESRPGVRLQLADGSSRELAPGGWDHLYPGNPTKSA